MEIEIIWDDFAEFLELNKSLFGFGTRYFVNKFDNDVVFVCILLCKLRENKIYCNNQIIYLKNGENYILKR